MNLEFSQQEDFRILQIRKKGVHFQKEKALY